MAAKGIVDDMPASQKYPYPTSDQPNNLTDEDLQFLSLYTGQKDLHLLREHVIKIWRSVKHTLWVYRCIQELMFLQPRIPRHPSYPEVKAALLADKTKPFLDLGCCFGQDTRQLILDGVPESSITATDITPDYWEFGKKLFMDPDRLSVRTAWGSFTDSQYIHSGPLSPMTGRFAYVWAGAVLHVLTAADVKAFITNVHTVLAPGGTFLGTCVGQDPPGEWADAPGGTGKRYLHREETLTALLKEAGYTDISMERDRSSGAIERQEDLSTFGNQKIILIFAATK